MHGWLFGFSKPLKKTSGDRMDQKIGRPGGAQILVHAITRGFISRLKNPGFGTEPKSPRILFRAPRSGLAPPSRLSPRAHGPRDSSALDSASPRAIDSLHLRMGGADGSSARAGQRLRPETSPAKKKRLGGPRFYYITRPSITPLTALPPACPPLPSPRAQATTRRATMPTTTTMATTIHRRPIPPRHPITSTW